MSSAKGIHAEREHAAQVIFALVLLRRGWLQLDIKLLNLNNVQGFVLLCNTVCSQILYCLSGCIQSTILRHDIQVQCIHTGDMYMKLL